MKSKSWVKQVRPGGKVVIGVPVECHHIHISIFFLPWPILGANNAVGQALELGEVLIDRASLRELEEGPLRIVVVGGSKTGLQSLQEPGPGSDESVAEHPLVPAKGGAVEVEGGDSDALLFRSVLIVKELGYLEYPAKRVAAIEAWDVQLDGTAVRGLGTSAGRGRVGGVVGIKLVELGEDGVDLAGKVHVFIGEVSVLVEKRRMVDGKARDGVLKPIRGGLASTMVGHGTAGRTS